MIAFSSELKDDDNLYSYFIGLDYRYNKSHRLYERILNETIKSAISNKKSKLILGRTAAEFKSNVGAQPITQKYLYISKALFCVVYLDLFWKIYSLAIGFKETLSKKLFNHTFFNY